MSAESSRISPYKGLDYFGAEDTGRFFGRDRDADQVVAKILSARVTVLHAPSGAGKTSLLNAKIVPDLESRGWIPVWVTPQNDPVETLRVGTLHYLLPPPECEVVALERAIAQLGLTEKQDDLERLLSVYDGLKDSDVRQNTLISPLAYSDISSASVLPPTDKITPYVCRLLRKSIEVKNLAAHLEALSLWARGESASSLTIDDKTPLSELGEFLRRLAGGPAYRDAISALYIPVPGLRPFFENLVASYSRQAYGFGLVLIVDQFEELFTRFVDPGPVTAESTAGLPDWNLRAELFRELQGICKAELPIRLVISLRDEYIARLRDEPFLDRGLRDSSYHLALLEEEGASDAIQKPVEQLGYSYEPECYRRLISELEKEGRFVEPSHLQIACSRLWEMAATPDNVGRLIPLSLLDELEGVRGILESFFSGFMEKLTPDDRLEALLMLSPLITSSGTRNLVEETDLLETRFHDPNKRRRLLELLKTHRLVRVVGRLGGNFVEITHEFLVEPINKEIEGEMRRNPAYWSELEALSLLQRFEEVAFDEGQGSPLTNEDFRVLNESRDRIWWTEDTTELMLRSAMFFAQDKDTLGLWSSCFEAGGGEQVDEILRQRSRGDVAGRMPLSRLELRKLNAARDEAELTSEQLELVLHSILATAPPGERETVQYWARRLASDS